MSQFLRSQADRLSRPAARAARFWIVAAAGAFLLTSLAGAAPAQAAKKKRSATSSQQDDQERPAEAGGEAAKEASSAQAEDKERPKPVLERNAAPKPDREGRVSFGGKAGRGKIIVKGAAKEKIQVFLEGRYFGIAPQTINKVPPGDYVVEAIFPDGKTVTRPVSVLGEEEAVVQIGAADETIATKADPGLNNEQAEKRWQLAKVIFFSSLGVAVVGAALGGWEYSIQQKYNDKVDMAGSNPTVDQQQEIDDLETQGKRLALATNACILVAAVGAITAAVIGYPAYRARKAGRPESESPVNLSFMVAPGRTLGSGFAGLSLQF